MIKGEPQPLGRPSAEERGYGFDGTAEDQPSYLTFCTADGERATVYVQDLAVIGEMFIREHVRQIMRRR